MPERDRETKSKPRDERPTRYRRDSDADERPARSERRARDARDSDEGTKRERREKASWEELVGLPDLVVMDAFDDEDDEYGSYTGTVVRLPKTKKAPSKDVLVLTSASTRAGKRLMRAIDDGTFDDLDGEDEDAAVPVYARAKKSRQHPDGHPTIRLFFGKAAEEASEADADRESDKDEDEDEDESPRNSRRGDRR